MNKTIELVNLWGQYEEKYPKGSIDDFCRHFLASKRSNGSNAKLVGGIIPDNTPGLLMKIIGRLSRLHMIYSNLALEGTGVNQIEEFGMLLTVERQKNPRKTEVIYDNLLELSSGTAMVNRLVERGLVTEQSDKEDKRAKRLHLTAAGAKAIVKCKDKVVKMVKMMTADMPEEDQKLCIQLLKDMEIKFSERWLQDKVRSFEDIHKDIVSSGQNSKG